MLELFQKIPVTLPEHVDYINKRQILLTDIDGKWFMEKTQITNPPIKRPRLRKEAQKKEDDMKIFKNIISIVMIGNCKSIVIALIRLLPGFII